MSGIAAHAQRAVLPGWPAALAAVGGCALLATAAPLLTYTVTLAVFGAAHVFSELRYVEARFAARLADRLVWGIGLMLLIVVGLRLARALGWWTGTASIEAELAVVAGLGAIVLPTLAGAGLVPLLLGGAVVAAVGIGLVTVPVWTMLTLACLHNWTPVGFLVEGLPSAERRHGLAMGVVAFLAVPVAIASGIPGAALAALGASWPELSVLPSGNLYSNLGAYLHVAVKDADWAVAAFSALVFAQCMHYATVIGVLPRIAPGGPGAPTRSGLSRLPWRWFWFGVGVLSLVGLVGYAVDFKVARRWYGLIAAVHAWIEVPVLLLALLGPSVLTASATDRTGS